MNRLIHRAFEKTDRNKQQKRALFPLFVMLLFIAFSSSNALGQLQIVAGSTSTIDFSSSMPSTVGTTPSTAFTGKGFAPDPTAAATTGFLNSNAWAVDGWSTGNVVFGGSIGTGTPSTMGAIGGAVSTAGMYAYTGSPNSVANPALMIQAGNNSNNFNPGRL